MTNTKPWEELANAVIIQAAKDYRVKLRRAKRFPRNKTIQKNLRELEHFFRSDWFRLLSSANGTAIIEQLRKEIHK